MGLIIAHWKFVVSYGTPILYKNCKQVHHVIIIIQETRLTFDLESLNLVDQPASHSNDFPIGAVQETRISFIQDDKMPLCCTFDWIQTKGHNE